MPDNPLTPSRLWRRMSSDQRMKVARAFWLDEEATDEQVQAVMLIAQQKKFRAKTVIGLDPDRKARHFATLASAPDPIVARALIAYHLAQERPMMAAFLDSLGVHHDNGLIQDDEVVPDMSKIAPAARALSEKFPSESVVLYLSTLLCQDPETWAPLAEVLPEPAER
jgi:hypothetical protein